MRISPTTQKNGVIILQLILLFVVPFCTTFLLDLPVILNSLARTILVYLLLLIEIITLALITIQTIKN